MKIFADMKGKKRKVRQVVHTSSPSTKTEAEGAKLFSRKSDTHRSKWITKFKASPVHVESLKPEKSY